MGDLVSSPLVEWLGWVFIHFLWQGTAVGMLAWLGLRLLQHQHPNVRYRFACFALVALACLLVLTGLLVHEHRHPEAVASVFTLAPANDPIMPRYDLDASRHAPTQVDMSQAANRTPTAVAAWLAGLSDGLRPLLFWLTTLWLLGVVLLSFKFLGGWILIRNPRQRQTKLVPASLHEASIRLVRALGLSHPVTMLQSSLVPVSMVVGWIQPTILFPTRAMAGLSVAQLEMILAHELAHIRRRDHFVNLLQSQVEILLFYHPVTWWLSHRIALEREYCCDDAAIALSRNDTRTYIKALVNLQSLAERQRLSLAMAGINVTCRAERLLGKPGAPLWDVRVAMNGLVLLALTAMATWFSLAVQYAAHQGEGVASASPPGLAGVSRATPDRVIWITTVGDVTFAPDRRSVARLGYGARVDIEERHGDEVRHLRIVGNEGSDALYAFNVENEARV